MDKNPQRVNFRNLKKDDQAAVSDYIDAKCAERGRSLTPEERENFANEIASTPEILSEAKNQYYIKIIRRLCEEDQAAVATVVMEQLSEQESNVSKPERDRLANDIASSPEKLRAARKFYEEWQNAGEAAKFKIREIAMRSKGSGGPRKG